MKKLFVGLPVLFFPTATDPTFHEGNRQPHAATVAHVHEDGTVNLGVLDANGNHYFKKEVLVVFSEEEVADGVAIVNPGEQVLREVDEIPITDEISVLTTEDIGSLSSDQIESLTTEDVSALSTEQVVSLTTEQIQTS